MSSRGWLLFAAMSIIWGIPYLMIKVAVEEVSVPVVVLASADDTVRLWPGHADDAALCAKLTTNMSHQQWRDWVSPNIDYTTLCPNLPTP